MSVFSQPFLTEPAWKPLSSLYRWPDQGVGTFAVDRPYLGGVIGLDPGSVTSAVATFFWTADPEGRQIVGVQGYSMSSLIPSMAQLSLPNHGPYLYLTVEPFGGKPAPLGCTLFHKDVPRSLPGDTILIDEVARPLAANASETIYPDDYYSGVATAFLVAPDDVTATIYGADLTYQWWPLDAFGNGSTAVILPLGAWMVVVSNANQKAIEYTLSVTPLIQS